VNGLHETAPDPHPARPAAAPVKKDYQPPRVQVHGDVRELTGSGSRPGISDLALSRNSFS